MVDKIMTLHPAGKQGTNISLAKYETMKSEIINTLQQHQTMTFTELTNTINQNLDGKFDGSISWYAVTVKLDLEARGVLERIAKTKPEQIRLVTA
ncbi:MAG: hypothetical protein AAF485_07685 [Chloroflexota bacterium]